MIWLMNVSFWFLKCIYVINKFTTFTGTSSVFQWYIYLWLKPKLLLKLCGLFNWMPSYYETRFNKTLLSRRNLLTQQWPSHISHKLSEWYFSRTHICDVFTYLLAMKCQFSPALCYVNKPSKTDSFSKHSSKNWSDNKSALESACHIGR